MRKVLLLLLFFAVGAGIGMLAPGYEPPPRPTPPRVLPETDAGGSTAAEQAREAPAGTAATAAAEAEPQEEATVPVVSGRIVDDAGRPVPDARIMSVPNPIYGCGRGTRGRRHRYDTGEGETAPDGTFTFRCRLPAGPFPGPGAYPGLFLVDAPGHESTCYLPEPAGIDALREADSLEGVVIVLTRSAELEVAVVAPNGSRVAGAEVVVARGPEERRRASGRRGRTDDRGIARLTGLRPDRTAWLTVRAEGDLAAGPIEVTDRLRPGALSTVLVTLQPAPPVRVEVTIPRHRAGAKLLVNGTERPAPEPGMAIRLRPGEHRLAIRDPERGRTAEHSLKIPYGATTVAVVLDDRHPPTK